MSDPRTPARPDAPRRPRHLMDPDDPRPPQRRPSSMNIDRVQKWVLSSLAVTTILHLVVGLVLAALTVDGARAGAREGLLVIAGIFGVLAIVAARAIHQKPLFSWWWALGPIPALVGAYFVY
jgi:hypothetical protein